MEKRFHSAIKKIEEISCRESKFSKKDFFLSLPGDPHNVEEQRAKGFYTAKDGNTRDDFSFFDAYEIPTMDACHATLQLLLLLYLTQYGTHGARLSRKIEMYE